MGKCHPLQPAASPGRPAGARLWAGSHQGRHVDTPQPTGMCTHPHMHGAGPHLLATAPTGRLPPLVSRTGTRSLVYADPQTHSLCTDTEHASTPTSSAGHFPQPHRRTFHRATTGRAEQSTAHPEPSSCLPAPRCTCLCKRALKRHQQA